MPNEAHRLADQLQRSIYGDAWHGPAVNELIEDLDWQDAFAKPIPNAHSIFELVHHIAVWAEVGKEACCGKVYRQLSPAKDWLLEYQPSQAAWLSAKTRCGDAQSDLQKELREAPESVLYAQLKGKDYSLYELMLGILQHNAYHAGQIALLKSALN